MVRKLSVVSGALAACILSPVSFADIGIFGLPHRALGAATLTTTTGPSTLVVGNLGSSGNDGVSIDLTGAGVQVAGKDFGLAIGANLNSLTIATGSYMQTTSMGMLSGTTSQILTTSRITQVSDDSISLMTDFSAVSTGQTVTANYYTGGPNGTLVYSETCGAISTIYAMQLPSRGPTRGEYTDRDFSNPYARTYITHGLWVLNPLNVSMLPMYQSWITGYGVTLPATDKIDFVDISISTTVTPQYTSVGCTTGGGNINSWSIKNELVTHDSLTWNGTANSAWNTSTGNWINHGTASTFTDVDAVTFDDTAVTTSVNLTAAVAPGLVTVNSTAHNFTLAGTYSLTTGAICMNGTSTLTLGAPATVNGPINLMSGTVVVAGTTNCAGGVFGGGNLSVASGAALTVGDSISVAAIDNNGGLTFNSFAPLSVSCPITGSGSLTQAGLGTTTITGPANYSGPTIITAGKLDFGGGVSHSIAGISGSGTLQVEGGTALTSNGVSLRNGTWTISGSHVLRSSAAGGAYGNFTAGHSSTILTGTSAVGTGLTFGAVGNLDIKNNGVIVEATSATKAALITQIDATIAAGHISSSTAATDPHYAVVLGDNGILGTTYFGGVAVDGNSILVTQALKGDGNFDGLVNAADLLTWKLGLGHVGSNSVNNGDFNNDGLVNAADLLIWKLNLGATTGAGGAPNSVIYDGLMSSRGGADLSGGSSASTVPEPASLVLLGLGAVGLLTRCRRNVRRRGRGGRCLRWWAGDDGEVLRLEG